MARTPFAAHLIPETRHTLLKLVRRSVPPEQVGRQIRDRSDLLVGDPVRPERPQLLDEKRNAIRSRQQEECGHRHGAGAGLLLHPPPDLRPVVRHRLTLRRPNTGLFRCVVFWKSVGRWLVSSARRAGSAQPRATPWVAGG